MVGLNAQPMNGLRRLGLCSLRRNSAFNDRLTLNGAVDETATQRVKRITGTQMEGGSDETGVSMDADRWEVRSVAAGGCD